MKRTIAILLSCVLILGLAACGSANTNDKEPAANNAASGQKSMSLADLKGTWYSEGAAYGLRVRKDDDGWAINYFNKTDYYRADSESAYDQSTGKLTATSSDSVKRTITIEVVNKNTIRIAEDNVVLTRQP